MTDPHDLYGVPLDRFVAERGALVKALRAAGHREQAASVAGLRKPSVAAWAVNQLVRTQSRAVASLFDAGDALQRTQSDLLAGRADGPALRDAAERERAAVEELVDASRGLLSSEGHELSQAILDRVSATLHAAALEEGARAEVRDGCLVRELRHVGLGAAGVVFAPSDSGGAGTRDFRKVTERLPGGPSAAEPPAAPKRDPATRAREARAERERAERRKAARAAEADARRVMERAARGLEVAEKQRERAAVSLRDAEEALTTARERAEEAANAHRRAQQLLERA